MEHTIEQYKLSNKFFQWKMGAGSHSEGIISNENDERSKQNLSVLNNIQSIERIRRLTPEEEQKNNETIRSKEQFDKEIFGTGKTSDRIFYNINKFQHEEYQYLNLIQNILDNGFWEEGRNGKTKSIFGGSMRFSLKDGKIPILTTKKTAWKTCLKELLWFIRGETDNKILKEQGVHIWDANGSREFLNSRGLHKYPEDMLGPIYGYQWRKFNASYNCWTGTNICNLDEQYKGVDQLQQIIDALKDPKQRTSRRLIMTAWNPKQIDQMALPPCHILCQFNVHDGNKLSCSLYQRSGDFPLGIPFNIASYSFLTHLIAKHCGLEAYEFVHFMGNCHLYENAIDAAKLQITREPYPFPSMSIKQVRENIDDYKIEDFEVHNYISHEAIKVAMIA
jgi:thymidylate synthase